MYAIIETGGKQYRVQPGDTIDVERVVGEPGSTLQLGNVLMVGGDGAETKAGSGLNAAVTAEVVEHRRGDKIIVFRFKSKVRYRRKTGHRQELTRLKITDISVDGKSARKARAAAPAASTPAPAAAPEAEPEAAAATSDQD